MLQCSRANHLQHHLRIGAMAILLVFISFTSSAQDAALPDPPAQSLGDLLSDPALFLRFLRSRDEQFDNMSIETEVKWTDHIDPKSLDLDNLPKTPLPEPYDQPHRVRYVLTVRGLQSTLQSTGELDPILHREFTYCEAPNLKQTNVSGVDATYSDSANGNESYYYENPAGGKGMVTYRRMRLEFAHGYGYAKHFWSMDSCQLVDNAIHISGPFHVGLHDQSYGSLELDRDYIVRKATITRKEDGKELRITVETSGTKAIDGPLAIATAGHYLRTVTFPTKPDQPPLVATHNDDRYTFVSVTRDLSDKTYAEISTINKGSSTIDISPNRKRNTASHRPKPQRSSYELPLVIVNIAIIIMLVAWNTMRHRPSGITKGSTSSEPT